MMKHCSRAGDAGRELWIEGLRVRGFARLRVRGRSMRPWLRGGEVVELRRTTLAEVRRGDVVAFARGGGLFVHRVIGKSHAENGALLITKGDAFPDADAPVNEEELLGRVTCVARAGGAVSTDTLPQQALGRLLACVSASARWWYPGARAVRRILRPVLG
jgi:signal peptidase I